jgi:single-stranded-DNA-specific exonuclease
MQIDALAALDGTENDDRCTICLYDEGWHQGVVGLVASRVKERFHRPTIAFARADAIDLRGSGRSIEGIHLRDTLDLVTKRAPGLLSRFGGHAMAAGLTLPAVHYDAFAAEFEAATRATCDRTLFARAVETDGPLAPGEIGLALINAIDEHVWGQAFPAPLFANEFDVLEQRLLKDRHLKLVLDLGGRRFEAIWFRRTERVPTRVRFAYRPVADEYMGKHRVQLVIEHAAD